jgi:hypothetical protein
MTKIKEFAIKTTVNFSKRVLLPALVVTALVGLSFIFFGPISSLAYSDRLFLVGIGFMALGAMVIFAQMITTRGMDVFFGNKREGKEVKKALNLDPASRIEVEERYNVGAQLWLIGLICMLIGAIITLIFPY